nr:hypothetical protein [Candidatus Freyarchaeota archaeon]
MVKRIVDRVKGLCKLGSFDNPECLTSLKNILVITSSGLCLVATDRESYDTTLLAGMLSALAHMGREIMDSDIESVSFKGQRLYYMQKAGLLFVAHTSETLSEHIVYRILTEVAYTFLEKYGDVLPDWSGDLAPFKEFEGELEKYRDSKILNDFVFDFLFKFQAKDLILFDIDKGKILLSTHPLWDLGDYINKVRGRLRYTKGIKKLYHRTGNTIIMKNEKDYVVNIIKGKMCLTVAFDQKNYDLPSLTTVSEEILEYLQKNEKIKQKGKSKHSKLAKNHHPKSNNSPLLITNIGY